MKRLKLIPAKHYQDYTKSQPITIKKHLAKIRNHEINYGYAVSVSAVSSSQIEGNIIDIDTYYKFSNTGMNVKTKAYREIKALENAYNFAREHALNEKNILHCHKMVSETGIIEKKYRGKYRDKKVFVQSGNQIVYEGAKPDILEKEMEKLFKDIQLLKTRELNLNQVFYYASMIHLYFVLIHPFADGNGRTARLIEKWFLSHHIGSVAWLVNSEKLYLKRSKSYHKNINRVGENYSSIFPGNSIPFLKMLPMALRQK
jgi:Fic family protein